MAKKTNQSLATRNSGISNRKLYGTLTPAPAGGLEVSLVIMIGDEEIILTGDSFKDGLDIKYSKPWREAVEIGSFIDGIAAIGKIVGNDHLGEDIMAYLDAHPGALADVAKYVLKSKLVLTDLIINTTGNFEKDSDKKDVYTLGLGFKFPEAKPIAGISAKAFLMKYTYLADHKKS